MATIDDGFISNNISNNSNLINLGQYGQILDGYKDALNQTILAIFPETWHPILTSILPAHWQE